MDPKNIKKEDLFSDRQRPIDAEAENAVKWWKKSFVFMRKTEVVTWKFLLVVAFITGFVIATISLVSFRREQNSRASLVPAKLFFMPAELSLSEGEQFNVDLNLDTAGGKAVVSKSDVSYDATRLQLLGWDTSGSVFSSGNACMLESTPCEIVNNDPASGKLSITLAKPSPGVSASSGKIATLTFKALSPISPGTSYLKIDYSSQGSYSDSDVILDDGSGTDTLSGVGLLSLNVIALDTVAPAVSSGAPSGELPSSTTQVDLKVKTDEKSSCKYSKSAGTSYPSMENSFASTDLVDHSVLLTGLNAGSSYDYYVRCQDISGNKAETDYRISFSVAPQSTTVKSKGNSAGSPGKTKR